MEMPTELAQRAVLEVFLVYGIPAGGRVKLDEVRNRMRQVHIRRKDFYAALRALRERGWVRVTRDRRVTYLELTEAGFDHDVIAPMRWSRMLAIARTGLRMLKVKHRGSPRVKGKAAEPGQT